MASVLSIRASCRPCHCLSFGQLLAIFRPNQDHTRYLLREADRCLLRIGRNLEKIDALLVGYAMPNEDRYRTFLQICERDIEEDLFTVEDILRREISAKRSKLHREKYWAVTEAYYEIRTRLQNYVDTS